MGNSLGRFSGICEGKFDPSSSCTQRCMIDFINLLFLTLFYLLLLSTGTRKHNSLRQSTRREWVYISVSISCFLTALAYLGFGFQELILRTGGFSFDDATLVASLLKVLIWISLSFSIPAKKRSKSLKFLVSVWWVSSFLAVSALNVKIIFSLHIIGLLEIMSWLVNFLLVICAAKKSEVSSLLSEPLVSENGAKSSSGAGFFSQLTFSWINPLLSLGYSRPLALEDIPPLSHEDTAHLAHQMFEHTWESLRRSQSNNARDNVLALAIAKMYQKEMVVIGIYAALRTLSVLVSPVLLYAFVNYANQSDENVCHGLILVGCLMVVKVVESFSQRHMFFDSRRSGMKMRSALMVAIYQKQLKLSSLGRKQHSTGEIVNYISVDAYRMGEFPWWFHSTWSQMLQLFLSIGVLFGVVGIGAVMGLIPLFVCGLLNIPFAKALLECQSKFMAAQDQRLRSTSEILNNMKFIKLQSWEEKFQHLVESLRENELEWLAKSHFRKAYGTLVYWFSPTIVPSVIFFGCLFFNSAQLNAGTIFTILATLRNMAEPVRMLPEGVSIMIQVKVSFDRLSTFLIADELNNEGISPIPVQLDDYAVKIKSGNFIWEKELSILTLDDLNLEVKKGQKVAICGPVGAGKSSLLYSILGEIPKVSGTVDVFGSIAYASQISWIQSGTIRANVVYGKAMDKSKYEAAIKACALDKDINSFVHGDLTEIGERGLNMSGGQKQRIQLARAVYSDADIYLLDDPFSALDAHTATLLFNGCVMGALKDKTVILVTHQVEFLSEVDKILVMEGGQVIQSGSSSEILMSGTAFEKLVNAHNNAMTPSMKLNGPHTAIKETSECEIFTKSLPGIQLTKQEETEIGDIGWKPFLEYFIVSKGTCFLVLILLSQAGFVIFQAASTYWLAIGINVPEISTTTLIKVYTVISTLSACFVYFRSFWGAHLALRASTAFFLYFTNAIFKAPMLFFDSTPIGRIFTRASSDLSVLDFDIPISTLYVFSSTMEVVIVIGIMASVTWQVLIVAFLAFIASKYVQGYYQASARELIRINGTTKAPVMNHTIETSLGVVTIRAYNMMDKFFQKYLKLVDLDAKLFFHSNAAMEWLILRIEAFQNLTLLACALLLVLLPEDVAPGLVGLSLSYALTLTGTQVFITRWYCNLSNYIVSVERMKQFMDIPSEPPAIVDSNRPPSSWPANGRIDLIDLKVRYRPNAPLVLKGITCIFKQGARVGIVGRTGSGKTTLITALFRLVEPDFGRILIDGVDICSIGLKDLRMKLSIIPQEPTLFRGSIRINLDPHGLHTDQEIWNALDKCQLKAIIRGLPKLLESSVNDEGENWSAGQRQLLCLGRALLRRNKILVLDEATASVDSITDSVIQRIIRHEFHQCTVITVAHRVPTVIDSDMVMVLSYGDLVEYDEPSKLLDIDSYFSKLVAEYWATCRRNSR